jgi:hypothetical protein
MDVYSNGVKDREKRGGGMIIFRVKMQLLCVCTKKEGMISMRERKPRF